MKESACNLNLFLSGWKLLRARAAGRSGRVRLATRPALAAALVAVLIAAPGAAQVAERSAPPAIPAPEPQAFLLPAVNITPNTADSDQLRPALVYNSQLKQWLAVWSDERGSAGSSIHSQLVDPARGVLASDHVVLDNMEELIKPDVAYDSAQNRFLVVWKNRTNGHIEGQVLNADNTNFGGAFIIASGVCDNPRAVYTPFRDDYLVVYERELNVDDRDILGRFVGVDGTADPGGAFPIAATLNQIEVYPAVVVNPADGIYTVVYDRLAAGGGLNVAGQRLQPTGAKLGGVITISSDSGDELMPDAALNPLDGGVFVVWGHDVNNATTEVRGRLLRSNGSLGGQPTISVAGGSDDAYPSITYAPTGNPYLVTWDNRGDIFGRTLTAQGAIADDLVALTGAGSQYTPAVAAGVDRYLVAYENGSGPYDVYGRFGVLGRLLFLPYVDK